MVPRLRKVLPAGPVVSGRIGPPPPTPASTVDAVGIYQLPRFIRASRWRLAGHADQIYAVAIARAIWKIMAQMSTVDADALAIGQDANIIPVDLAVAERRPAMHLGLLY